MSHDPDCVFCKIVKGDLPCFKLLETDLAMAFMDINPFNDGHCLVITKDHYPDLFEARQDALIAVAKSVPRVAAAVRAALQPAGLNIVQANGPAAGQTVFHYHCHVFPRRQGDEARLNWVQTPGDMARIEGNYRKILTALEQG